MASILLTLVDNDGPWTHLVVERGDGEDCPIRVDHKIHVRGLQLGGQAVLLHMHSLVSKAVLLHVQFGIKGGTLARTVY